MGVNDPSYDTMKRDITKYMRKRMIPARRPSSNGDPLWQVRWPIHFGCRIRRPRFLHQTQT